MPKYLNSRKKLLSKCIIVLSCFYSALAFSEGVGVEKEKYCGSGISSFFVPDKLGACNLKDACKKHDICYGRCDKGGDLFGSDYCKLGETSSIRKDSKKQCDDALLADILQNNKDHSYCAKVGALYEFAVEKLGQGPFNGHEVPEVWKIIESSKDQVEVKSKLSQLISKRPNNLNVNGVNTKNNTRIQEVKTKQIEKGLGRTANARDVN